MKLRILFAIGIFLGSLNLFSQPIVGGSNAAQNEIPFIVALNSRGAANYFDGVFCGGSLIAPGWVLTAAHCLYDDAGNLMGKSSMDVLLNIWKLSLPGTQSEKISISDMYIHSGYNDNTMENDIALLKLSSFSTAKIIKLVNSSQNSLYDAGKSVNIAGWGLYDIANQQYADVLRKANIEIISSVSCNSPSSYDGEILSNMFCAGKSDGSKDACQGDSGGPLFIYENGDTLLTGIVSWGQDCAKPNYPGVYTKIISYLPWINNITQGAIASISEKINSPVKIRTTSKGYEISVPENDYQWKLSNFNGQTLSSGRFHQDLILDCQSYRKGIAILTIISDNAVWTEKLVIQ